MNIQELMIKINKLQLNDKKELWVRIREKFDSDIKEFRLSYIKNRNSAFQIILYKYKDFPNKIEFIENAIEGVLASDASINKINQNDIQNQINDYYEKNIEELEVIFQDIFEKEEIQKLDLNNAKQFTITKLLELNSFPKQIINVVIQKLFKDLNLDEETDLFENINSLIKKETRPVVNKIVDDLTRAMSILLEKESFIILAIGYFFFFKFQKPLEELLDSETEFNPEYFSENDFHLLILKYIKKILGVLNFKEDLTENEISTLLEEFYFVLEDEEYNLKIDPFPWLI